jgi:hypothetical protein
VLHPKRSESWRICLARNCSQIPALAFWCELSKNADVKTVDFKTVKRQEARSRMRLAREAARSPKAAAAVQKRVSLVGDGAKWKITNFKQFARATAQWA